MQGVVYVLAFFYIEKFTNEERRGDVTLYAAVLDVTLEYGRSRQPVLSRTRLVYQNNSISAFSLHSSHVTHPTSAHDSIQTNKTSKRFLLKRNPK
jgi:hypothetical protein